MPVYFNLKNRPLTSLALKFSIGRESLSHNNHYMFYFILLYSSLGIIIHHWQSYVSVWSDICASSPFVMSCCHEEIENETFSCDSMFTCQLGVDQNFWTEKSYMSFCLSIYLHNSYLVLDTKTCLISITSCILEREALFLQVWHDNSTV